MSNLTILRHSLSLWHLRHLRHVLWHSLVHDRSMGHVRRCVVGWERVVGVLSSHVVTHTVAVLLLRRGIGIV